MTTTNPTLRIIVVVIAIAFAIAPIGYGGVRDTTVATVTARVTPASPVKVLTTRVIPRDARIDTVNAYVNGHPLNGWVEAPRIAGLGGHAVAVQVTFTRRAAPAVVRIASARPRPATVRVVIDWHTP